MTLNPWKRANRLRETGQRRPRSEEFLRVALICLLFGLCSACSSFDTRWKAAATGASAERWEGRWTSEKHKASSGSPMGGRLRAVIEPAPKQALLAYIHANWLLFSSDYSISFQPKATGSRRSTGREFSGTHELPKMFGGTYRYEARLVDDHFQARYTSSYDHGTFTLLRLHPAKDYSPAHARH